MIRRSIVLLVLATMVAVAACASMSVHPHREIFDDVPATIDPGARYLFHMHGWVVEEYGPVGAVRTGYWWRWTVEAFADRGFVVISEARTPNTYVQWYALTVARQVARLRAAGVRSGTARSCSVDVRPVRQCRWELFALLQPKFETLEQVE